MSWLVIAPVIVAAAPAEKAKKETKTEFLRDIRPIFQAHCFSCHGPEKQESGLRLDDKTAALAGGDGGKVIRPGDSAKSPLFHRVHTDDPDERMPPEGRPLNARQIELLQQWIDDGAAWPDESAAATVRSRHWAFQPLRPSIPVPTAAQNWAQTAIDQFVLTRLDREKLTPNPRADRATLIRRLSLDLLGLPPTPAEVSAFVGDTHPAAYERLLDRLLASPHFGERWGRHWLDLARYADSDGYEKDLPRPFAYRFRDWVIAAINNDMPFDQFTIEQLAGDLLPQATLDQLRATGFHRNTLTNREGGIDKREDRDKQLVDRVNTTATVWLGLTLGCCQCHSHKYDPLTQREFYGVYAFFDNANERDLPEVLPAESAAHQTAKQKHDQELARLRAAVTEYEAKALNKTIAAGTKAPPIGTPATIAAIVAVAPADRTSAQQAELAKYVAAHDDALAKLRKAVTDHAAKAPKSNAPVLQVFAESPKPAATRIHLRGDFLQEGDPVVPHTPAVLPTFRPRASRADRLDLARWLVDPAQPLTPRVVVNRIWNHLFGRGLVFTTEDFGTQGEPPSHPELLDWLAREFATNGWSQKRIIRTVVTSAVYQQSSAWRPELLERDPKNVLLARQNRFRLEAEGVRDAALAVSGLLTPAIGGPSVRPPLPAGVADLGYAGSVKWTESTGTDKFRRGLYIFFQRTVPYPMLMTFDSPDSNLTCTRRERSNTPLQALTLLNDPVFMETAQALARRVLAECPSPGDDRMGYLFTLGLGRLLTGPERTRLAKLQQEFQHHLAADMASARAVAGKQPMPAGTTLPEAASWVLLARAVCNLDEFVYRE